MQTTWHHTMDRVAPLVVGLIICTMIILALGYAVHRIDKKVEELQTPTYGQSADRVD